MHTYRYKNEEKASLGRSNKWKFPSSPLLCLCLLSLLFVSVEAQLSLDLEDPAQLIGIHLGSTYARVGAVQNGQLGVLNSQGKSYMPSYVAATDSGFLVGEAARRISAPNLFQSISEARNLSCSTFTPEEIYTPLLLEARQIAESHLGTNVTGAVVTIPDSFDDSDRDVIKKAGDLAGLPIHRVIRESTAVSLAYGLDEASYSDDLMVLIYDLGGQYLDVTLVDTWTGIMDQLATVRTARTAGEDFDRRVVDYFAALYEKKYSSSFMADPEAVQRLAVEVEQAKRALSEETSFRIEIPRFHKNRDLSEILTRDKFEELNSDLFESTLSSIDEVLQRANLTKDNITTVVLAGGSSQIPKVQRLIQGYFPDIRVTSTTNPAEAAVWGATLQAYLLQEDLRGNTGWMPCCCPTSHPPIGIGTRDGVVEIIPGCHTFPTYATRRFTMSSRGTDNALIQVYVRDVPSVDYHAIFEMGEDLVPETEPPKEVLLGEFDLPVFHPEREKNTEIEVSAYMSRHSVLKVRAVNKATGDSRMITFPNLDFRCGQNRNISPGNYSYSQGPDLEEEYKNELQSFVGVNELQKPVQTIRNTNSGPSWFSWLVGDGI